MDAFPIKFQKSNLEISQVGQSTACACTPNQNNFVKNFDNKFGYKKKHNKTLLYIESWTHSMLSIAAVKWNCLMGS